MSINDKEEYKEYLNSEHWKIIREARLKIDNNECKFCGSKNDLHVHHLTYKNKGNEKMYDLITLCKKCHLKLHEVIEENIPKFEKTIDKYCDIMKNAVAVYVKEYTDEQIATLSEILKTYKGEWKNIQTITKTIRGTLQIEAYLVSKFKHIFIAPYPIHIKAVQRASILKHEIQNSRKAIEYINKETQ